MVAAASLQAQSLGDVARKEEERRKNTPPATKVYTNQDLSGAPAPAAEPAPKEGEKGAASDKTAKGDNAPAKEGADKAAAKPGDQAAGDKTPPPQDQKDQKYWKQRADAARLALERDSGYLDAMQSRINALTTEFVNRDDPAQRGVIERDRQRALTELDRLKKQIADDRKAISDLEEEARRAGVPPGWLR